MNKIEFISYKCDFAVYNDTISVYKDSEAL